MNEDVVYSVSKIVGFSPLEIILISALVIVVGVFWRFIVKMVREMIDAVNNNTQALNEIKGEMKETRDEMARKLKKAGKP